MYKASLDTLSVIISIGCTLIIGIIIWRSSKFILNSPKDNMAIAFHIGIMLFLLSVLLFSFLFSVKNYQIDSNENLIVNRYINQIIIKRGDIMKVKVLKENELSGGIRKFGVGGLFGYYGIYYFPNYGNITLYTTRRDNRVLLILKNGKKYIISPDDTSILN